MNLSSVLSKEVIIPVAVGVVASAGGFAAGYIWRDRKKPAMTTVVNNAIPEAGLTVRTFEDGHWVEPSDGEAVDNRLADDETVKDLLAQAKAKAQDRANQRVEDIVASGPDLSEGPVSQNVFEDTPEIEDEWDQLAEMIKRRPVEPYIISYAEFHESETDYQQLELTYYAADDVLCDDRDNNRPIYNHKRLVGDLRFGHGSGDLGIVYIRNDQAQTEWEVSYNKGYYSVEVMGLEIEDMHEANDLKHSQRPMKMRRE